MGLGKSTARLDYTRHSAQCLEHALTGGAVSLSQPSSRVRLEPTARPADEPGFYCQAVSVQLKEARSNRRDAMDAEADHSQPPENLSLQGARFRRLLPRSFLCGHRASAVPLHTLSPNRCCPSQAGSRAQTAFLSSSQPAQNQ